MSREKSRNKTTKIEIGQEGEKIIASFLESNGFKILEKNFQGKGFEIDIIARKRDILHFIEVKTISVPSKEMNSYQNILPYEHIDKNKVRRIRRGVMAFLKGKGFSVEKIKWQIDFISIKILSSDNLNKKTEIEEYWGLEANY